MIENFSMDVNDSRRPFATEQCPRLYDLMINKKEVGKRPRANFREGPGVHPGNNPWIADGSVALGEVLRPDQPRERARATASLSPL